MKTIEKIISIAKKLKKEAPNKFAKWTDYVKEASKQIKTKSKPIIKKAKKFNGILDTVKRKSSAVKKNITYNVIDKVSKSANNKEKQSLKKAKELIKKTYIGESHKDSNSHNVKLSIYSGTGLTNKEKSLGYIKPTRSSILKELEGAKAHLDHLTAMYKDKSYSKHKAKIKRSINKQNKHIGNILESL